MERCIGLEPTLIAWKAMVLPFTPAPLIARLTISGAPCRTRPYCRVALEVNTNVLVWKERCDIFRLLSPCQDEPLDAIRPVARRRVQEENRKRGRLGNLSTKTLSTHSVDFNCHNYLKKRKHTFFLHFTTQNVAAFMLEWTFEHFHSALFE